MAKAISGGSFRFPDDAPVSAGKLVLRLSEEGKDSTGQIVPVKDIVLTLDANGDAPSTTIIANDEIVSPRGTFYWAELQDSAGNRVWGPVKWVISGTSPINLDNMTPTVVDPAWADPLLKNPTADQTINGPYKLLPDATGRDLGSTSQRWDVFSQALDNGADAKIGGVAAIGGVSPAAATPLLVDKTYTNPSTETAGARVSVRRAQTSATGADKALIGGNFSAILNPGATNALTGRIVAGQGEILLGNPSGALTFPQVFGLISTFGSVADFGIGAVFGANATITTYRGLYIGAPPSGGGAVTTGYGIEIEAFSVPATKAAVKLAGTGDAGRILWTGAQETESPFGTLNQKVHANAPTGCPVQVIHADGSDSAVTGTTSETTLWSYQLPANALRGNDGLRFRIAGVVNGTNNTKTIRFKVATTTIATITETAGETDDWVFEVNLQGRDSTVAQSIVVRAYQANAFETGVDILTFTSENMATAVTFSVSGQLANIFDSIIKRHAMVEYLPKP